MGLGNTFMGLEKMQFAKRLAALAVAGLAFGGVAHGADTDNTAVTLNGTAEPTAYFSTAPVIGLGTNNNMSLTTAGDAASVVTVDDFIDDTTAKVNLGSAISLKYADVYANYAHFLGVQVTNGGLIDTTPTNVVGEITGTFIKRIDYQVSAVHTASGLSASVITNGTAGQKTNSGPSGGAARGDLEVQITLRAPANPNDPVLAGDYSDTITIQIGAAI